MRIKFFIFFSALFLFCQFVGLSVAFSYIDGGSSSGYLNIATFDARTLSIDRLLYVAFKDLNIDVSFSSLPLQTGYDMANNAERDGVIASTPDIETDYPSLIKVPVPLERTNIFAFVSKNSGLTVRNWGDLSSLKVGIVVQRPFIESQIPSDAKLHFFDSGNRVLDALAAGVVDVAVLAYRRHETIPERSDIVCSVQLHSLTEYLYLNEKFDYLIDDVAVALNSVFDDGRGDRILKDITIPEINSQKTILHIISTNNEIVKEEKFIAQLKERFKDDGSLEWYSLDLNSRRFSEDSSRLTYFAQLLRQDCVSRNIAVIIVSGYNALEFINNYYLNMFANVPVLFYSVGENYSSVVRNGLMNYTGVVEHICAYDTVWEAISLFPDISNVFVLNDYTTEGRNYKSEIEKQLEPLETSINIEYSENLPLSAVLSHMRELPPNSMVLIGSYFRDANGHYYSRTEMTKFLSDIPIPIFALYSNDVGYNAIGGKCLDYGVCGGIIAEMLDNVLSGVSPSHLPVVNSEEFDCWFFDKNLMDVFDIKKTDLPKNAVILNEIPSIWESDPKFAIALIALLIMGIIGSIGISTFVYKYNKQREHLLTTNELLNKDAKIREVKDRLESIINTAPVAYILTIAGKVVEANEYIKKNFGVKVGDNSTHYYADPDERRALISLASQQNLVENVILKFNMVSGEVHRFLSNVTSVEYEQQSAFILWAMDIEESERQKDRLNALQQSLQTVLDLLPVPIGIADIELNSIIYINRATVELFELSEQEDTYGHSISEFMPIIQPDGTNLLERLGNITDADSQSAEIVCFKSSGELFDCRVDVCLIDYGGKKSLLSIMTDLTAKKEYESMLLRTANKEKEANQLKSKFLVNMSHEIRTPMNAIIGLTEIELRKEISPDVREIYKKINTSAKNLLSIINDILDLSKIEANKIELFDEEFELEEVISNALLVAAPRLDGKNVEFMLNSSLDLPRFVVGDRTRLWQILKNFLDNSAKYTEKGKIVLTAFVDTDKSTEELVHLGFIIEDTGIGIPEEQLHKLFMPYAQVYNEAQKRYAGTGLGMVISKQFCKLMGGEMRVESRINEGTTIYLKIPFKRSSNTETELSLIKTPKLSDVHILAVDDDELSLSIMSDLITGSDACCELAHSGEEAMSIIFKNRDNGISFDLILLDYMMSGLNGLETAKKIQSGLSETPKILMVTAYQRLLLKHELEKYSIDDVIEKPFIPSLFIRKLCAVLGKESDHDDVIRVEFTRFKDVHVLLCEDYRLNQEVASGMFAQFGVTCTIAENGKKAIEILNSGMRFDIIFMDLQMPVMNGYEATEVIRADSRFDNIPIISLTADAMIEITEKCMEIGMNGHIAKPIEFDSLHKVFLKWIPEHKRLKDSDSFVHGDFGEDVLLRFGGDRQRYEKALLEFANELPDIWLDYNSIVNNVNEVKFLVHKIKGVAGNLAEMDIYKYAADFEKSLRNDDPDEEIYGWLIGACNDFKKHILSKIDNTTIVDAVDNIGTIGEFKENLIKLRDALIDYDLNNSLLAIDFLQSKTWPIDDESRLNKVVTLVQDYNYDAALDELESMGEMNCQSPHA